MTRPEDIERLCDVWLSRAPRGASAAGFLSEVLPAVRQVLDATGAGLALRDGSELVACGDLAVAGSAELADGEDTTLHLHDGVLVRRSGGEDRQRYTALFRFAPGRFEETRVVPAVEAALSALGRAIARLVPAEERRFGDFEIIARLDEGGMAEVHLARTRETDELVALKRIRGHLGADEDFLRLFLSEVRTAQQIHHENVVRILEYGVEARRPYLAMEYLRGVSLARLARRARAVGVPLRPALVLTLARHLCAGLHAVHEQGIVHCDVSPQNLLVTFEGVGKVIDFGVARQTGLRRTGEEGPLRGKLGYLAPEQLAGEAVDRRADVYSLGVVIHELLSGAGREPTTAEAVRRYGPAGLPPLVRQGLPTPVAAVVRAAVEPSPGNRLPSCLVFSEQLTLAASGAGLRPAPPAELAAVMRDLFGDQEAALKRLLGGPLASEPSDKVKTFRLE